MNKLGIIFSLFCSITIGFISCDKKKETTSDNSTTQSTSTTTGAVPTPTGLVESTKEYIKFTLQSTSYSAIAPDNGVWSSGFGPTFQSGANNLNFVSSSKTFPQGNTFMVTLNLSDTLSNVNSFGINEFRNFIKVRNYAYAKSSQIFTLNNVNVLLTIKDNNNVNWHTTKQTTGSSIQTGSTFSITEVGEYTVNNASTTVRKFKALFNCKLYRSNGDSTQLTNGECILSYTKN